MTDETDVDGMLEDETEDRPRPVERDPWADFWDEVDAWKDYAKEEQEDAG